mmetsp:Transcript_25228/g.34916  ORF Transcript_25228/g.34916 Transcript_25228/m.34916 type:complete len:206 (-) Transcript_25228:906-1523(-)
MWHTRFEPEEAYWPIPQGTFKVKDCNCCTLTHGVFHHAKKVGGVLVLRVRAPLGHHQRLAREAPRAEPVGVHRRVQLPGAEGGGGVAALSLPLVLDAQAGVTAGRAAVPHQVAHRGVDRGCFPGRKVGVHHGVLRAGVGRPGGDPKANTAPRHRVDLELPQIRWGNNSKVWGKASPGTQKVLGIRRRPAREHAHNVTSIFVFITM